MAKSGINISLQGRKQVARKLDLQKTQVRRKVQTAVNSGAQIISNDASERAPVLTGNLKRSIHVEPEVMAKVQGPRVYCEVGTDQKYGKWIEFGTPPHPINSPVFIKGVGWRYIAMHPGTEPKPFLRPALDANRDEFRREVRNSLKVLL